jgi:hypothetical protein
MSEGKESVHETTKIPVSKCFVLFAAAVFYIDAVVCWHYSIRQDTELDAF